MKKHFSFLTLLLGMSVTTVAAPIQPQKAKQLAENFFKGSKNGGAKLKMSYQAPDETKSGNSLYYIINRGDNQGFVVVSGDTRTRAILAYSDKGYLNEEAIHENPSIHGMFIEFAEQIEWAQQNIEDKPSESYKLLAARNDFKEPRHLIEPLLVVEKSNRNVNRATPISWGQDWPFNLYSPNIVDNGRRYKTVSGCVATGIATVMRWHAWPARPQGYTSYTWESTGKRMAINYDEQPAYDWNNMPEGVDAYGRDNRTGREITEAQADNIGRLLRDVGYGVKMDFGPAQTGGSGTFLTYAPATLVNNFNYDGRLRCISRQNFSDAAWWAGIQDELTNYGPIVYAGYSRGGGHCFVVDGLAENRYVHVDWGWNYSSNCWTSIDVLEPGGDHGIGGGIGAFNRGHQMLRYLKPDGEVNPNPQPEPKPQPTPDTKGVFSIVKTVSPAQFYQEADQRMTVSVKNISNVTYNSYFKLSAVKQGSSYATNLTTTPQKVYVGSGSTKELSFYADLRNLEKGNYDLRISYVSNGKWTEMEQSAGRMTISSRSTGAKVVATSALPTVTTFVGEAVRIEVPVMNAGDADFNGTIEMRANGTVISGGEVTLNAEERATLAFSTNTRNFQSLKAGTYNLTITYGNGQSVTYGNSANLGTLIIKSKQQPATATGDVRLNSAFFYQNGQYVGSKYSTVSKNADLTIRAYLYSSNGFKGAVKLFITDSYGKTSGSSAAHESVKNIQMDKYGSGYVEFTVKQSELTSSRYYVNLVYNDGKKDICRTWDGVAFYVSAYDSYYGTTTNTYPGDKGTVVNVNGAKFGDKYIAVGANNDNLVAGETNGIGTIAVQSASLYPTVASETITIATAEAGMANIFSAAGAKVAEISLKEGNNTIAVSQFTPGVYFVKVANKTLKFVKK
ncbi:C10 family peptidase [Prevotella aurantiaca]|uniref:Thiol protease/hemagglutinin PrtT n=1 Tax=Prevotella aurantiaca TaxID=596085 RepID=A0A930HKC1_9BACT|nr:C10 family peptidase [Prevotella aurantiaca]MBF1383271.1 thiol protease/hemagglutinin PrtT [Prevotella aurantiaca]